MRKRKDSTREESPYSNENINKTRQTFFFLMGGGRSQKEETCKGKDWEVNVIGVYIVTSSKNQ